MYFADLGTDSSLGEVGVVLDVVPELFFGDLSGFVALGFVGVGTGLRC